MTARSAVLGFALSFVAACSDDAGVIPTPENVSASLSDTISTVVSVSWTTPTDSVGYVEFGTTEAMELASTFEATPGKTHTMPLLGMRADTLYYYRVVTWDGNAAASDIKTIRTGPLPAGIPASFTLTEDPAAAGLPGFVVIPLSAEKAVVIVDADGYVVWYHVDDSGLDLFRARVSLDVKSVIYNRTSVADESTDDSALVRVALDGSGITTTEVPRLAHDFVEHTNGTIGAIAVEVRDMGGTAVRGDQIVEVSPTGDVTTAWSAWDCFDPAEVPGGMPGPWTFANSLELETSGTAYYVGFNAWSSVVRVSRTDRSCPFTVGTSGATLSFDPASAVFAHQNGVAAYTGNRLLVMDGDGSPGESRLIEYELDLTAGTATELRTYVADLSESVTLGNPTRFTNSNWLVNWGSAGRLELVNPMGVSEWRIDAASGTTFGLASPVDRLYPRVP